MIDDIVWFWPPPDVAREVIVVAVTFETCEIVEFDRVVVIGIIVLVIVVDVVIVDICVETVVGIDVVVLVETDELAISVVVEVVGILEAGTQYPPWQA